MKITDTSGQDVVIAPKSNKTVWLKGGVVAIVVIALTGAIAPSYSDWANSDTSISRERLRLAKVTRGDFVRDLSVQGRVVAAVSPKLYSPAQGTITFQVDAGDSVTQNQVLASIDSPELTNELQQEEATLQRLQIELDRKKIQAKQQALNNQKSIDQALVALTAADREKRRADKAIKSNSISAIDFEKAQDELENARLEHKHAVEDAQLAIESFEFELKTNQLQVDRQALLVADLQRKVQQLTVRSPVSGIVGNLAVEQKNQVAQNQAILSVVDLSEFEVELQIPESYADDLAIGMDAEIQFNGEAHSAVLVTISPEIQNNQVTGRVRFANSSELGLRQNQRLTTRILMENKADVLMVQRGQFLESAGGKVAYVVQDNRAVRTAINTGARSLGSVEILTGLNIGDEIIISSTEAFAGAETVLLTQ
ncbi:efflux RND transporter periplasmic adaptor subunit [Planctobacterium marinum]|uniref:RND transporter MFP subunit n=1 Tax=Planctobacterium marinum TaxID=1631968 RepID=A0AA48HHA6_9ALTE|nr:RND transporter MFP subunit [Planctobacterium marinum]